MRPDISSALLPADYLEPSSNSLLVTNSLWPAVHEMEINPATTYWSQFKPYIDCLHRILMIFDAETNDWNTLGKYPFSTKIRIWDEAESLNPEQTATFTSVQKYSPTHSRHTSRSVSNESDHAEEHVSPSPLESSPATPYETIPSHGGLVKLSNGQWQCPYCHKQFRRRDRGQAHVNVHINARPYRCDGSCGNPIW